VVGEPASLFGEGDRAAQFLRALAVEELVRLDNTDELIPRLAEKVPSFENGLARIAADDQAALGRLQVTFILRGGLTWQDGLPITADDIVFAWQRDREATPGSRARADAELVDHVEVVDSRTARFILRPGARPSRYALLARVMPRHVLDRATAQDEAAYRQKPMHAGPFHLASWQDGLGATFTPFVGYALGKPRLSRIEVRFYTGQELAISALQTGEVEMVPADSLTAELGPVLEPFAEGRALVVRYTPQVWGEFLLFNLRGAYADERLRRAIVEAIDRKKINQRLFSGRARLPSSYLLAPSWAAADGPSAPDADHDAARAQLAAAGFCGTTRCSGAPTLQVRLVVEAGSTARIAAAEMVADDLKAIGAVVSMLVYPPSVSGAVLVRDGFDLAIVPRGGADPADASEEYVSASPRNATGYADPAFDGFALMGASLFTRAERKPLYTELQRIWAADAPALPLYQELAVDVLPASLEGLAPSPFHEPLSWNAYLWRHTAP
jgi:peptide/nickel transport system substrate-binding protein